MLGINKGIIQRNIDGSPRLVGGKPVSAAMTLAVWPDDALKVLLEARDDYLASLAGSNVPNERTDEQKDFSTVFDALTRYGASVGATKFSPGKFPARTGLVAGEECGLVR
jgi:hypothetical protein